MAVVVAATPHGTPPFSKGAYPRRPAPAPPAIEDHLGGIAVAEALLEELEELGPLGRHDIEVTTRRGHGDKRRRFAPNLPEALPWEAMWRALTVLALLALVPAGRSPLQAEGPKQVRVTFDVRQASTQSRDAVQGRGRVRITQPRPPRSARRVGVESTERRVTQTT